MPESEIDTKEGLEKTLSPGYSKLEREGPTSTQTSSGHSSPSVPAVDMASSSNSSEGKSTNYFAALDTAVEALQNRAQNLIDNINEGRNKDQTMMKSFHDSLAKKVTELSQRLEDTMYHHYDQHNTQLQEMLQELPEIIERIGALKSELKQVCETVANVYKDLGLQPEL